MSTAPAETEPIRHRGLWAFLIVTVLLIGAGQICRLYQHRGVLAEKARLHEEGYPTDLHELARWHGPVPDDQNAALNILEAADYLAIPAKEYNPDHWPVHAEPLTDDLRESLGEVLTNNAAALEAVHLAAVQTRSRFPIDYERGPNALLPHLAKIKSLTQLLRAKVLLAADAGDLTTATDAIVDSVALGRSLDAEPLLISQLVRMACLSITCTTLERLLTTQAVPGPQLLRLADAFRGAREASQAASQGGLVGESCFANWIFTARQKDLTSAIDATDNPMNLAQIFFPLYVWTGLRDRDYRFYLHRMHEMIDTTQQPYPERIKAAANTEDVTQAALGKHRLLVLSRMMLPALGKSTEKGAELEARLRCAQIAIAVELARAQHQGAIPAKLDELHLTGSVGVDPMNGQPLRYQVLERGYIVYSVGRDGIDDGGAERMRTNPKARRFPLSSKSDADTNAAIVIAPRRAASSYDLPFLISR